MDDDIFNQDNATWVNPIREICGEILTGIYASVIFIEGRPRYYFMNEYTEQRTKLFLSKEEYIKTYYLPTPSDVVDFLQTFNTYCGATEIELD